MVTQNALRGKVIHTAFVGIAGECVPGVMRRVSEGGKGSFVCAVPKRLVVVRA